jgi:NAD(P)-dependent dehydrogenase (short-subunit alcohol dehydrogenase family)
LTLLKNVQRACAEILVRFQRVNFLVLTAGGISLKGLDLTEEGVDRKMALMYYGRWKFIHDLLPGLRAATAAGEDAKVMSMLSAGNGPPIDVDDLGLKKNFTIGRAMQVITYQDVMVEVRTGLSSFPSYSSRFIIGFLTSTAELRRPRALHHLHPFLPGMGAHKPPRGVRFPAPQGRRCDNHANELPGDVARDMR